MGRRYASYWNTYFFWYTRVLTLTFTLKFTLKMLFSQMMSFAQLRKKFIMGLIDGITVPFGFSDLERWLKIMKFRPKVFKPFKPKYIYKQKPMYKIHFQVKLF